LEKWLIAGMKQRNYKVSQDHFIMSKKNKKSLHNKIGTYPKDIGINLREFALVKSRIRRISK
jgi:hypothetical protein